MAIKPENLIEAFQSKENFPFGSRTIDFYEKLGYQKKGILDLLANGTAEAQSKYDEIVYVIGLTEDEGGNNYVNIIPKEIVESALSIKKMSLNIAKQKQHNRRF